MNIRQKVILIVMASILVTAVPGIALIYSYAQRSILATESAELEHSTARIAKSVEYRFSKSKPKLASFAHVLEKELAKPIKPSEIEAFHSIMEMNPDGVWRNRKTSYNGSLEAGIFLPKNTNESDKQKIQHLRIKNAMDTFGAAASEPFENIWYLSLDRSEIIFDRALPEFVFEQKHDNDYTQTPWVTYTSPQLNPQRETKFTPPLFDPVPKIWMVSAIYPLYVDGKWIGSLGEDMQLTGVLESMLSNSQRFSGTQHLLLDAQGNYVLAGPWQKQLESNTETFQPDLSKEPQLAAQLESQLTNTPRVLANSITMQGKRYMIIGVKLNPLGWKYFRLVPVDEVIASSQLLLYTLGVMVLLVTVLTGGVIGLAMGSNITRRIRQLGDAMKAYAADHSHRIAEKLGHDDEIAEAARIFDGMADDLDRKTLEQKLVEEKLRTLFVAIEQSPTSIVITDLSANLQYVNPQFTRVTGYTAEEALGANPRVLQSGLTPKEVYRDMWATITAGKAWSGELINKRKNGEIYWEEAHISPVLNDKNEITQYVGVKFDITERKQSEKLLAESNSLLMAVINTAPIRIFWKDQNLRYLGCNSAFAKDAGLMHPEDLIGKDDYQLAWAAQAELYRADDRAVMASGIGKLSYDEPQETENGHLIWLRTSKVPLKDQNNESIGVLGVYEDITDYKLNETNLRIAAIAFEAQEGIIVTDVDNIILRVNKAFTSITGYSPEDAVGQTPKLLASGRQGKEFYELMWKGLNSIGSWEGEIWNRRKNGEIYPEHLTITAVKDATGTVTNYVATLTDITMSKAASEEIRNLAFYDPLTQLPNRRLLLDRLRQALVASTRSSQNGALLFLDLDHFKTLNDTLGHDVGDLLLQQVASRLTNCVREGDTVARLGGDEFVVLLEDLSEQAVEAASQTKDVAEKIIASLNQPYQLSTHSHHSTSSIGATLFNGHELVTDELLKQADIAMYQAKSEGRNTLRFFDPMMQEAIAAHVNLENELRRAIEQEQFQLYYQVQVDGTGNPTGAEALIRWFHPQRDMISPFHFIPLAEETGLILPIGQWVLETACAQLKAWQQHQHTQHLTISINVSAKQIFQANYAATVRAAIEKYAVNPALLKLELTEGMLIHDVEKIIITMVALQTIGVRFELDDFGTGYSSLQYLKRLPLCQLKIDQSFVREIDTESSDQAIVRTIIAMAQSMNLDVIAEGVETNSQLTYLRNYGCTNYQGYLFSKPLPIEEFEQALKYRVTY